MENKRQRKKWLKKHNLYISNKELWNLDSYLVEYILPRLKKFRQMEKCGCPIMLSSELDSMNEWNKILDKMIMAFELIKLDNDDLFSLDTKLVANWKDIIRERGKQIDEGLQLFAKYFTNLWD